MDVRIYVWRVCVYVRVCEYMRVKNFQNGVEFFVCFYFADKLYLHIKREWKNIVFKTIIRRDDERRS